MRILVTGTQGQVARSLQERGRATGVDVALVGRPGLDLAQPDAIADALAAFDADVVINVAAYTAVDKAETEEELATRINGAGAGVVAAAAAARGLTLLDISTDYVFGGQGTDPRGIDLRLTGCVLEHRGRIVLAVEPLAGTGVPAAG